MPVFTHVSVYPHPRAEVFAWHERPGGFVRLTPPGMAAVTDGPTDGIRVGSELTLRISDPILASVLPRAGLRWLVRHVELEPGVRFVDEQVSGPLKSWRHEHLFSDAPGGGTTITDRVTWTPPVPLGPAEVLITRRLKALFAFRETQLRDDLALHARLDAPPAHVLVTGASGLIGRQVCALLTTGGHTVTRLVRNPAGRSPGTALWDPAAGRLDPSVLDGVDAVVHLAGETIAGRFTSAHKRAVLASRVDGTTTLAQALAAHGGVPTLIQASAIGFYGPRRPGELLTEDSAPGTGFLADVVRAWEEAAEPARAAGVRTVFLRTGIVLTSGGGALAPQLPLFLVGAGGRLTRADAWTSWITLDDIARAYLHALFTPALAGPVNGVAPDPVTAGEFAATMGRVLRRPAVLPTPPVGPALLLGREGASELVETDQRVAADRLLASGFEFGQPRLPGALAHALGTA